MRARKALTVGTAFVLAACGGTAPANNVAADSVVAVVDTTGDSAVSSAVTPATAPKVPHRGGLSPLADSIAQRLVFVPRTQDVFLAAARGKRMLVDLGRIDTDVSKPTRMVAFREAAAARSPIAMNARLELSGPWGVDTTSVTGFDVWNGRIVAVTKGAARVDSLAKKRDPLIAVVGRVDTTLIPPDTATVPAPAVPTPPAPPSGSTKKPGARDSAAARRDTALARAALDTMCVRDTVDTLFDRRLDAVRDSLLELLRAGDKPSYPRLLATLKEHTSRVTGCFPQLKGVVVVSLVGGDYEWVRERIVMVPMNGPLKAVAVRDFRFRAHDVLQTLDVDRDGVDEIAARAYTERAGGTVVLRLVDGKRLERVVSGFAWERQ